MSGEAREMAVTTVDATITDSRINGRNRIDLAFVAGLVVDAELIENDKAKSYIRLWFAETDRPDFENFQKKTKEFPIEEVKVQVTGRETYELTIRDALDEEVHDDPAFINGHWAFPMVFSFTEYALVEAVAAPAQVHTSTGTVIPFRRRR